jgi:murein DD-endopeptidase MepM/ murein hydrolase activator NlpD
LLKTNFGFARAKSLRAAPGTHLFLAAALVLGVGFVGHVTHPTPALDVTSRDVTSRALAPPPAQTAQTVQAVTQSAAPAQAVAGAGEALAAAIAPQAENVTREAELEDDQSFSGLLTDAGASAADATSAMNALGKIYDLRKLKSGQDVTLSFTRTDRQETLTGAIFQPEATKEISVTRAAQGYVASAKLIPVVHQRLAAQGEIRSSLFEAGDKAGVPYAVMASLIRVYSHDVDFQRDIHPGDTFELLYDQPTTAQGKAVGEGSIIYAALNIAGKSKPLYRVTFSDNTVDYFDAKGQSIRRALLRTPVAAAHITSGFGMRMHPILGYSKMHKGVDFAAPIGTPIFAAGTGIVEEIGMKNGYGRYIRLRHAGTLGTAYAHMSRFNTGLYRGAQVNQGQVIGYVGMSGRATGPHLHFEVLANGVQVNPMSVNLPTGRTLDGKLLAQFKAGEQRIQQEFSTLLSQKAAPQEGLIRAAAGAPAFLTNPAPSCGLRGGC